MTSSEPPSVASVDDGDGRVREGRAEDAGRADAGPATRKARTGLWPNRATSACYMTLDELIAVHCDRSMKPSAQQRRRVARECYEQQRGVGIVESYFCRNFIGGAILTSDGEIHIRYPPEKVALFSPAFEGAIWRCIALSRKGGEQLQGSRRAAIARPLYSIIVYLLGVLDAQTPLREAVPGEQRPDTEVAHRNGQHRRPRSPWMLARRDRLDRLPESSVERVELAIRTATAELDALEGRLLASALEQARQRYLWGMLLAGVPALLLVAAAVAALRDVFGLGVDLPLLIGLIAFGGLGATLSVMSRLTSAMHGNRTNFTVDHESGATLVVLAGAFRPIVGALFAVALFVLVEARLVPVELTTSGEETRWYAYWGLAFLAGFTERFAQDAVSTAKPLRAGGSATDDEPAPDEDAGAGARRALLRPPGDEAATPRRR